MPARIAHLSVKHQPTDARIFRRQCTGLAEAGFDVRWLVPAPPQTQLDGVALTAVPHWVSIARKPLQSLAALRKAGRVALAQDAAVYVLHDPELLPTGLWLKRQGRRVIFDAHEHYRRKLGARGNLPAPLRAAFARGYLALEGRAKRRFDGFVAAAEHIAAEYPAERTVVLHNYPRADLARAPAAPLDPDAAPRLIYTGGWTAYRGVTQIVAALPHVRTPDVRLSVLGIREAHSTVYDDATRAPGFGAVDDVGYVPYDTMLEHMRGAQIGLVLNQPVHDYQNAQPNKLFEYMAVGLPVIASNFPKWREILEGSGAGVTVDPTDPTAIAAAIDAMLARPVAERRAMGAAGRKAVLERYSFDAELPAYLDLIERILAEAPPMTDPHNPSDGAAAPPIVFIGGTGRSGTNVTKQLLGRHRAVSALPFEHRMLIDPDGPCDFYATANAAWSPFNIDRRLQRLEAFLQALAGPGPLGRAATEWIKTADPSGLDMTGQAYGGWALGLHFPGYADAVRELIDDLTAFRYRGAWVGSPSYALKPSIGFAPPYEPAWLAARFGAFFHGLVAAHLASVERETFVEDNTWNLLYAPILQAFCPQARFVHVVRDPRDVVASFLQQRWTPRSLPEAAAWYEALIERSLAGAAALPADSTTTVRLEALVDDPEGQARGLCEFAGLDWDPAVLDEPLKRDSVGRWRRDLDADDQAWLARRLAPWIERFGVD